MDKIIEYSEKLAEGANSTVYVHRNKTTVMKIIKDRDIGKREMMFLKAIEKKQCKNVLLPISMDPTSNSIIFPRLTPINLLPFNLLDNRTKIKIIKQIIDGLIEIHSLGVIHNDLKLENIMYDINTLTVKIIDFSSSLFVDEIICPLPRTTPLYNSPETIKSFSSDIWSLGICILKLCGFSDKTILARDKAKLKNTKNNKLVNIARLCLSIDPKKRLDINRL